MQGNEIPKPKGLYRIITSVNQVRDKGVSLLQSLNIGKHFQRLWLKT